MLPLSMPIPPTPTPTAPTPPPPHRWFGSCSPYLDISTYHIIAIQQQQTKSMMKQLLTFLAAIAAVGADEYNHRYKEGDRVDLWVNKVRDIWILVGGGADEKDIKYLISSRSGEINPPVRFLSQSLHSSSPPQGRSLCQPPRSLRILHPPLLRPRHPSSPR